MFDFGSSWLGIIFNPVGYMAQRKSPEKAAQEYAFKNPTSILINKEDNELSFKEDARNWIDACAAKLKSDDVGKSLANCQKACEAAFYSDSNVVYIQDYLVQQAEAEKAAVQAKIEDGLKTVTLIIGAFIFVGLIAYLLTSKK